MGQYTTPPLKTVNNDQDLTAWCGPTVVGGITGKPLSDIKALIKVFRGDRAGVMGTYASELRYALDVYGFHMDRGESIPKAERPTLAEWLRTRAPEDVSKTYIINVSFGMVSGGLWGDGGYERGHWMVVRGRKVLDTFTKGEPVNLRKAPHRRKRVKQVFLVTSQTKQQKTAASEKRTKAKAAVKKLLGPKKDPFAKSRASFYRQIKRLGGNVEYATNRGSWVTVLTASNRICKKSDGWEATTFDQGDFWKEAADFLKTLRPSDFKVHFTLKEAA